MERGMVQQVDVSGNTRSLSWFGTVFRNVDTHEHNSSVA